MLATLLLLTTPAPAQETHTTEERPMLVLAEAGIGSPTGLMGGRIGYESWEVGGGLGATGYKVTGMWKHYWKPFDSEIFSFPVGGGPSVGLLGETFGGKQTWDGKDAADVLFTAWLNGEISAEWRARWGGVWRWTLGGALRVAENQVWLCEDVEPPSDVGAYNDCYSQSAFPSGPVASRLIAGPYIGFAYGYAF